MPLDRVSISPAASRKLRRLFPDVDRRTWARRAIQWKAEHNWPEIWTRLGADEISGADMWSTTLPLGPNREEVGVLMVVEDREGTIESVLPLEPPPKE